MASGGDMEEVVEVKEVVGQKKKIDRHCAFCLTLVPGAEVQFCSKCRRRAYCSKECQVADWNATPIAPAFNGKIYGYGQGHKDWCGLSHGEEDLDWKVMPIEGKGLGIVALRDIPYLYRIMVEGMQHPPEGYRYSGPPEAIAATGTGPQPQPPSHPAMSDLHSHPANSDISTKFMQNHVTSKLGMNVGLRLSRINHCCRPNAAITIDPHPNFAVFVVAAVRDIKAGEEICRSYVDVYNFPFRCLPLLKIDAVDLTYKTPGECREELSKKWGIVCPPSCPCRDEQNAKLLEKLKKLGKYCVKNPLKKPALKKFQKIMETAKQFGVGPEFTTGIYFFALALAVTHRESLEEAKKYLQMALDTMVAVLHPKTFSQTSVLPDISKHPKYLAAEHSAEV